MMHGNDERFAARLDGMVKADRLTKEERRGSALPVPTNAILRIQLKHARTRLGAAVEDGYFR